MKRIVAMGAAAAIGSLLFVAPAEAAPTKHHKPTVEVTHDDFTIPFAAGEACAFPVTFHGVGTSTVITRKRTIKTFISDATATITNTTTGKTVKRNANTIFVDHLRKDGSSRSTSKGNSFFWGEDLTIKGKPAPSGLLLVKGKAKFTIADFDDENSNVNFTRIKGRVIDVCTLVD